MTSQQIINNGLWMVPQAVYKETKDGIEIQIVTYYLGISASKGFFKKYICNLF